jgi:fumarate reductase subunit D
MQRFRALFSETWWLWLVLVVGGSLMALISPIFLLVYPICVFVFFWFAFIRYDEDGNFKGT